MGQDFGEQLPFIVQFRNLINQERFEEAERLARAVISDAPKHYVGYYLLGFALRLQGKLPEAKRRLRRAIKIWPTIEATPFYPAAYLQLGLLFRAEGRKREARAALERAVAAAPDWSDAYGELAATLHEQGKLEEAIAVLGRAVGVIQDAQLDDYVGQLLSEAGRLQEAETSFRQAMRLAPKWAAPWFRLGVLHTQQRLWDSAEDLLREAVRLEPQNPRFRSVLRGTMGHGRFCHRRLRTV